MVCVCVIAILLRRPVPVGQQHAVAEGGITSWAEPLVCCLLIKWYAAGRPAAAAHARVRRASAAGDGTRLSPLLVKQKTYVPGSRARKGGVWGPAGRARGATAPQRDGERGTPLSKRFAWGEDGAWPCDVVEQNKMLCIHQRRTDVNPF